MWLTILSPPEAQMRNHYSLKRTTDDGDSSSSLHTIPFKNSRGRKSTKKKREEASYLAVLEGSQKTLKGMLNTRSKKGLALASKGANPFSNSN